MNFDGSTHWIDFGDYQFPIIDCGEGAPIILLHGFPDSRWMWRNQIPVLANSGYRVIAPDLRGFGDAYKPAAVEEYEISKAVQDIIGFLDKLSLNEVSLIGHDWGAAVAWVLAAYHPERVTKLISMSVGCPGASGQRTIEQRERFWFFYFFQFEGIAEAWLQYDNWKLFREWSRGEGDTEKYIQDLSRPGALTAALNWYRANVKPEKPSSQNEFPEIKCPTMGIWSAKDNYMTESHVRNSYEKIKGPWRYEIIHDAGHWMMLEKPDAVNSLILDFLK